MLVDQVYARIYNYIIAQVIIFEAYPRLLIRRDLEYPATNEA